MIRQTCGAVHGAARGRREEVPRGLHRENVVEYLAVVAEPGYGRVQKAG